MRIRVGVQFLFAKALICKVFRYDSTKQGSEDVSFHNLRALFCFCLTLSFNDRSVVCAFFQQVCASFNVSLLCSTFYSDNGAAAHSGA